MSFHLRLYMAFNSLTQREYNSKSQLIHKHRFYEKFPTQLLINLSLDCKFSDIQVYTDLLSSIFQINIYDIITLKSKLHYSLHMEK